MISSSGGAGDGAPEADLGQGSSPGADSGSEGAEQSETADAVSDTEMDDREIEAEAHLIEDLLESAQSEMSAGQVGDAHITEAVELAKRYEGERNEYLDQLQRVQAEFQNYKRRIDAQRSDQRQQAAADLVKELLPVLDACEAAIGQGHDDVEPVRVQILQALERNGLTEVSEAGVEFDPNIHEAVLHEEGEGETVVAEVMRTGYLWNDRVVRAAMVKVRG